MIPDKPGVWRSPEGEEIDVYDLEPVGVLCVWGPDVGQSYSGAGDAQGVWDTDEWQGHIPVARWCADEEWVFVRDGALPQTP